MIRDSSERPPIRALGALPGQQDGWFEFLCADGRRRAIKLDKQTTAHDIAALFDGDVTWLCGHFPLYRKFRDNGGLYKTRVGFDPAGARDYLRWLSAQSDPQAGPPTPIEMGAWRSGFRIVRDDARPGHAEHGALDQEGFIRAGLVMDDGADQVREGACAVGGPDVKVAAGIVPLPVRWGNRLDEGAHLHPADSQGGGGGNQRGLDWLAKLNRLGRFFHRFLHRVCCKPMVNGRHVAGNRHVPSTGNR